MSVRDLPSRLLVVADAEVAPEGPTELVARAHAAGARFFELRRKTRLGTAERVHEARACLAAAPASVLLVNDRVDVALAARASGAHVGQDDLPPDAVRRLLGPEAWLGLSTHDEEQFARALEEPVDYVALGPIFASSTKSGHAEPVGLDLLRRCAASTSRPVVAIGGLDVSRAGKALEAGAAAVAVVSALLPGRVEDSVRELLAACGEPPATPREPRRHHWVLTGLPGAGKSSLGRALARRAGRRFEDLDEHVVKAAGASVARLFEREGEAGFRRREARALDDLLAEEGPLVLALGGGALESAACRASLRRSGAFVAWLDATPATCAARLGASGADSRPLLAGLEGPAALEEALARLGERRRRAFAEAASERVAADADFEGLLAELLRTLGAA